MPSQVINLNNTTPAAPANSVNVKWQADAPSLDPSVARNVSAYVSQMIGDSGAGGSMGLVPAPAAGDAAAGKVLKADGSWYNPNPMTTEGDLIVGGTSSGGVATPARLAAATAGLVLTSNGAGVAPSWKPATGASGGGAGLFSPLISIPTLSGLGMSTSFNQSATYSQSDTAMGISVADTAGLSGDQIEGFCRSYPSSAFSMTALIVGCGIPSSYTAMSWGIFAAESLSGKVWTLRAEINSASLNPIELTEWNSYQSYQGAQSKTDNLFDMTRPLWLRWRDDGTNCYFEYSMDGVYFWILVSQAKSSSWLAANFGLLGFFVTPHNGPVSMMVASAEITYP